MPSVTASRDALRHGGWPWVSYQALDTTWECSCPDAGSQCQRKGQAREVREARHTSHPVIPDLNSPIWKQQPHTSFLLPSSYLSEFPSPKSSSQGVEDFKNGHKFSAPCFYVPFNVTLQVFHPLYWPCDLTQSRKHGGSNNVQLSS